MSFITWVRVEDAFGQFDHPKGVDLPAGVTPVEDYPEHVGPVAREPKAFTDKSGTPTSRTTVQEPLADEKPEPSTGDSKAPEKPATSPGRPRSPRTTTDSGDAAGSEI